MNFDSGVLIAISVSTLLVMAGFFWYLIKKNPGMKLGEILSMKAVEDSETIFVLVLILLNFAEGMMAAAIHPEGQQAPNPMARFIAHLTIQLVSIIGGITVWRDTILLFTKAPVGTTIIRFLKVMVANGFLLGIPILNLFVVANGLNQAVELDLFFKDVLLGYSEADIDYLAIERGLKVPYSSWANLSYIMAASLLMMIIHILLVVYEGLAVIESSKRRSIVVNAEKEDKKEGKKEDKKESKPTDEKSKDRGDEENTANFEGNIEWFLRKIKTPEAKVPNHLNILTQKFQKVDVQLQLDMARHIAEVRNNVENMEKKNNHTGVQKVLGELIDRLAKDGNSEEVRQRGFGHVLSKAHLGKN